MIIGYITGIQVLPDIVYVRDNDTMESAYTGKGTITLTILYEKLGSPIIPSSNLVKIIIKDISQ